MTIMGKDLMIHQTKTFSTSDFLQILIKALYIAAVALLYFKDTMVGTNFNGSSRHQYQSISDQNPGHMF